MRSPLENHPVFVDNIRAHVYTPPTGSFPNANIIDAMPLLRGFEKNKKTENLSGKTALKSFSQPKRAVPPPHACVHTIFPGLFH